MFRENRGNNIVCGRTTFGDAYTKEFHRQIKNVNFTDEYGNEKEEEWLGSLIIGKDSKDYFLDNMTFFETVGSQITIAITNAKIYRQCAMYHAKRNGRGRITYDNKLLNKTM